MPHILTSTAGCALFWSLAFEAEGKFFSDSQKVNAPNDILTSGFKSSKSFADFGEYDGNDLEWNEAAIYSE